MSEAKSIAPGTPLPWHEAHQVHIKAENGWRVATVQVPTGRVGSWDINPAANARYIVHTANTYPALVEALEAAEAAIARITEGDGGMSRDAVYRRDGVASKHDQCPHGRFMYEGCATCVDQVLDPVLDSIIRPALSLTHAPGDGQ